MNETIIAWTNATWNPVHGCSMVSEGCRHCYAMEISHRYRYTSRKWTAANAPFNVKLQYHKLKEPYSLKQPSRIFVNSMSDLFHEQIPDAYIAKVFEVMNDLPQHTFQVLTKRPERAAAWAGRWTSNIWMGTSVEDRKVLQRIDALRQCQASTRFLSCEPLLEDLGTIDLSGIHWVIAGGESGPNFRPMKHEWAENLMYQCIDSEVAFFFKQSSHRFTERGTQLRLSDGSIWEWRQFPDARRLPRLVKSPNGTPFPESQHSILDLSPPQSSASPTEVRPEGMTPSLQKYQQPGLLP